MRRISRVEYDNMVRDLLGDTTQPATAFVPESPMAPGVNFETNTYTSVSALIVQQYQQAAETLAQAAVSDTNRLNNVVLPCHTQDDACAQQFIASFANRAFRGQLDATESAGLFQVYSGVKAQFDFATGIQAVITAVLESPRFLYVLEFGQGSPNGAVVALSPLRGRRAAGAHAVAIGAGRHADGRGGGGAAVDARPDRDAGRSHAGADGEGAGRARRLHDAVDAAAEHADARQGPAVHGLDCETEARDRDARRGADERLRSSCSRRTAASPSS